MKSQEDELKAKAFAEYLFFHDLLGIKDIIPILPIQNKYMKEKTITQKIENNSMPIQLSALKEEIKKFDGCILKRFAINTVAGEGVADAPVMFIGEAPGEEEDINGIPFCGRSGRLLEKALERIGLARNANFYITNSVFWRPPGNRKPEDEELAACRPFLERMIKIIRPQVIVCVGSIAISNATFSKNTISSLRRKEFNFKFIHEVQENFKVITLYHPSFLLRNPLKKREMYLDLLWFVKNYGEIWLPRTL